MNIPRPVLPVFIFSFGLLSIADASAAISVTVTDGTGLTKPCGDLVNATREKDSLTIATENGSCLGSDVSAATPEVVAHSLGDVYEGAAPVYIQLAADAVVHFNSAGTFTTTIAQHPLNGSVVLTGSIAKYTPPIAGTNTDRVVDEFKYTITDVSGSATGLVTIPLVPAEPVPVPTGTSCTEPADGIGLDCMGELRAWPAGTIFNETLHVGATHAWSFTYDGHKGSFVPVDTGHLLELSVSSVPGVFNGLPAGCYVEQVTLEQKLKFSVDDLLYYCKLVSGQKYYFNLKTTGSTNRSYDLIVY